MQVGFSVSLYEFYCTIVNFFTHVKYILTAEKSDDFCSEYGPSTSTLPIFSTLVQESSAGRPFHGFLLSCSGKGGMSCLGRPVGQMSYMEVLTKPGMTYD